jgi:hypothetical protein
MTVGSYGGCSVHYHAQSNYRSDEDISGTKAAVTAVVPCVRSSQGMFLFIGWAMNGAMWKELVVA